MPFQIAVNPAVLHITLTGAFTSSDLHQLFDAVRAAESGLANSPHRLTDLTAATGPQVTFADVLGIVKRHTGVRLANPIKSAIVAPGPVQFGFARMYQSLANHPQVTVQVFRDLPSAQTWLSAAIAPG